jgi:hypothetical protein
MGADPRRGFTLIAGRAPAGDVRVRTPHVARPGLRGSEVDLEPQPVQVVRLLEPAGVEEDGDAENRVLPVEVDLDELVEIPVEADIDYLGMVGPEVRVGQAAGEDRLAQRQVAVSGRDLEGPQAEMARVQVEGAQGIDQRPVADRLTASWTTAVGGRVWSGRSRRISREATRRSSSRIRAISSPRARSSPARARPRIIVSPGCGSATIPARKND